MKVGVKVCFSKGILLAVYLAAVAVIGYSNDMRIPFNRMLFVCAKYGRALYADGIYLIVVGSTAIFVIIELPPSKIQDSTSLCKFLKIPFVYRMSPTESMEIHLPPISLPHT